MKYKQLGLRVLSTAALMSIVTSIAASAFAGTYYMDNGNVNVEVKENGDVYVNGQKDEDGVVTIKGGSGTNTWNNKAAAEQDSKEEQREGSSIGESYPVEEEPEETDEVAEKPETEEPAAEEAVDEAAEETDTTEDAEPAAEDETSAEDTEQPEEPVDEDPAPAEQEAAEETDEAPAEQQPEAAATQESVDEETPVQDETPEESPNTISIKNDWKTNLKIILDNVRIKASGSKAAMSVTGKGSTTIELDGDNVLDSSGTYGHAGLEVGEGTTVTVTDTDGTVEDRASLKATGGNGGAGIGGAVDGNKVGNIVIEGTTDVTATGSKGYYEGASGIGTGGIASGNFPGSSIDSITIGGDAKVTAVGVGNYGSGIGGSYAGEVGDITITGNADVTATSKNGVGIGAGQSTGRPADNKDNTTITINDHAKVDASGATGIGSSGQRYGKVNIKLADFAKVKATSTSGAAIGTGSNSNSDLDITIGTAGKTADEEHVEVDAEWKGSDSKDYVSAAIGGGAESRGVLNILIQGGAVIKRAKTGNYGCGIGSGTNGNQSNYPLSGSIIIKDDAKVEYARGWSAIGFIKDHKYGEKTSDLKILGNATLEDLQGYYDGIGASNITIGDDTGKVTIKNLETSQRYYDPLIRADERLTIASNADITLTQPNEARKDTFIKAGVDADGNSIYLTKEDVEKIIGDDGTGKITYRIKDKTTGEYTLQYVAHGKNGCIWELDESQSVASTCTTKGKAVYVCKLEDGAVNAACHYGDNGTNTKTIELELADHSWNEGEVTIPATCTTAGVKTYTCTVCQATRTETIDALGHDFRDGEGEWKVTTPATCTTEGVETRYCHNNAEHTETRTISKLAHNFADGEWQTVTEATCTTEGTRVKKCKDCDALDTEHPETIPATGHAWGEWKETTAPKCEEVGEETRVCANDKTHVEHREVPATGHQHLTEGVNAKAPTCEEPGYTGDTVCDDCGKTVTEGEEIPAKGHTPTVIGKKDPTANEPGYTGDTVCDDCGKVLENGTVIPATGSDDDSNAARELRVVVPSNTLRELRFTVSQKGGERTYTCKQDNATLTGTLETLQYLQSQGTDTIVFVTNGRVSRFAVADLLALCNEGDVFYLCHTADAEPTLLIIANDHTELLNK